MRRMAFVGAGDGGMAGLASVALEISSKAMMKGALNGAMVGGGVA